MLKFLDAGLVEGGKNFSDWRNSRVLKYVIYFREPALQLFGTDLKLVAPFSIESYEDEIHRDRKVYRINFRQAHVVRDGARSCEVEQRHAAGVPRGRALQVVELCPHDRFGPELAPGLEVEEREHRGRGGTADLARMCPRRRGLGRLRGRNQSEHQQQHERE